MCPLSPLLKNSILFFMDVLFFLISEELKDSFLDVFISVYSPPPLIDFFFRISFGLYLLCKHLPLTFGELCIVVLIFNSKHKKLIILSMYG